MMECWDIGLLVAILATVISIPLLAEGCVLYASWTVRREVEAEERRRSEAERGAQSLLREVMSEQEYLQLSKRRYVEVQSPHVMERVYRVHLPRDRAVDVYESGQLVARLCIHPGDWSAHGSARGSRSGGG